MPQNYSSLNPLEEMRNIIPAIVLMLFVPPTASAQFYTITKEAELTHERVKEKGCKIENERDTMNLPLKTDSIAKPFVKDGAKPPFAGKGYNSTSLVVKEEKHVLSHPKPPRDGLPELTIPNLYEEIRRNRILYPKIVLAQAIFETGWFRSPACRNKNNLFGLTNLRTGKYFEFNHWTESVRAYYTMVQYKYKGGNYLLWLRDIGYAEDPNYVRGVIGVLKIVDGHK